MKTKLKPILLLCALSVSALNVLAQNFVVTSDTTVSGTHYENRGNNAAALSNGGTWTFTGSDLTLTGTAPSGSSGMDGARANGGGGVLNLFNSIISANRYGIYLGTSSTVAANHNIIITGADGGAGIYSTGTSTLTVTGGTITTTGSGAWGIHVNQQSTATVNDGTILTNGHTAHGIYVTNTSTLIANGGGVVTEGDAAVGVNVNRSAAARLSDFTIETSGSLSVGLEVARGGADAASASMGNFERVQILTHGENTYGVRVGSAVISGNTTAYNYAEFTDSIITTDGRGATGVIMAQASGYTNNLRLVLDHTTVTAAQGHALAVGNDGERIGTFDQATDYAATDAIHELIIRNGTELNPADGKHAIHMDTKVTGTYAGDPTIVTSTLGHLELTAQVADSAINGSVSIQTSAIATLDLTHSTLTGDLLANENVTLALTGSAGTVITGNVISSGSANTNLNLDHSTLTGNITANDDSKTTVNISDGGVIIGDLIGNDNSALAMTVGDGGTLNVGINGERVTVTVDTGGNVILNKDSNFGALNNHGTLNIGDYQVSVSDLENNGIIAIAVNTDSGAHGTLHVTGTSSGAGTIHVTSTGDGQANPNDVLGNLVTGNGTANYTWDEVDWGLEELIVTPNPDGTITVKEDGTSPAGAVLNSAIAVQQSLWFAQQNSLLKRMGELRYGARASRPLADKDVRVPYNSLIENIWLRSYGQQLNIGSQVAGKAYEQLIYGVDLGTDHKFTLSADSDLYLGVYAGYGRSDIDYRTPGADGELNSYYGGLYATWLHSSGFYIDATVKAASVDNNLKAPHGNTQLKANYSDINLGGSLELGKKFTFTDDWFIEPQFQVNYLHILAEDYTAGPMTISTQDLDALQLRIGSLFGRSIKLTNGGALQPYVKISGVETISTGGTLRNGYQSTRANTDGARAELGAGLIWQLDTNNQLHLDYEASFGDKYDKPWGLTAGYRHQF